MDFYGIDDLFLTLPLSEWLSTLGQYTNIW